MPTYKAPVDDALFLLNDVFNYERYGNLPGFADATPDVVKAILEEGGKFAEEVLQPLNQIGDRQGCKRGDDGAVTTPEGFKEAYGQMAEAGWIGLIASPDYGGQGLPYTLGVILNEFISSANMAFGMYPGLSNGAYVALDKHGSDDQKALYLPRLASGKWSGTMNLTEPHCGTDLGLIRTKAVPQGDGSYKITGTKIFISAGEHDLTENIVHLVLARIEGAEAHLADRTDDFDAPVEADGHRSQHAVGLARQALQDVFGVVHVAGLANQFASQFDGRVGRQNRLQEESAPVDDAPAERGLVVRNALDVGQRILVG